MATKKQKAGRWTRKNTTSLLEHRQVVKPNGDVWVQFRPTKLSVQQWLEENEEN